MDNSERCGKEQRRM